MASIPRKTANYDQLKTVAFEKQQQESVLQTKIKTE